jgi:diaminopimelate decarboxylase
LTVATQAHLNETVVPTWERLDEICRQQGPSFYLADLPHFEANCRRFLDAFRSVYPRTSIGYSYKTNYLPAFILRAHALGAYSEVVSRFEFDIARELGVGGQRIVYNGPIKRADDLRLAFSSGALVNADSIPELWEMTRVAKDLDGPARAGVRCYLGAHTPGSRFGVDVTAPEGADALAALDAAPNVRLAGLHCHHSGDRSAAQYRDRTRAMIALHREALHDRPLDYMDIGGGFASTMSPELARQLESASATFEDYAEAVGGEMRQAYGTDGPELILEPGMALLADTMTFVTRVETVKSQHRQLAVVDGSGFNIQPPWNLLRRSINLPVRVVAAPGDAPRSTGPWDVVGHTCIEKDVLHDGHVGPVGIGDYVLFDNVGAYTNVLNAPFIRGTPPIVTVDGEDVDVLRPRSTARDLVRTYITDGGGR